MTQVVRTAHAFGTIVVCGFEKMVTIGIQSVHQWRQRVHITIFPKAGGLNTVLIGFYTEGKAQPQVIAHHDKDDVWVDCYVANYMADVK